MQKWKKQAKNYKIILFLINFIALHNVVQQSIKILNHVLQQSSFVFCIP